MCGTRLPPAELSPRRRFFPASPLVPTIVPWAEGAEGPFRASEDDAELRGGVWAEALWRL